MKNTPVTYTNTNQQTLDNYHTLCLSWHQSGLADFFKQYQSNKNGLSKSECCIVPLFMHRSTSISTIRGYPNRAQHNLHFCKGKNPTNYVLLTHYVSHALQATMEEVPMQGSHKHISHTCSNCRVMTPRFDGTRLNRKTLGISIRR